MFSWGYDSCRFKIGHQLGQTRKNSILSFILLFLFKDHSQTTQLISHKNNQIKQSLRNFNNRNTEISFWHAVWENEGGLGLKNN